MSQVSPIGADDAFEASGLRLDPDAAGVAVTGLTFRAPLALPVVWET